MQKTVLLLLVITMVSCNSARYIYIVRHAEKADSTVTSALSPAGRDRALALRNSLIDKNIDLILATTIPATQETAQPLAGILHKTMIIHNYNAVDNILETLAGSKNKNALIVDHRGTIPAIIAGLTGQKPPAPEISDYGNLYVIKIIKGKKQLFFNHYGSSKM